MDYRITIPGHKLAHLRTRGLGNTPRKAEGAFRAKHGKGFKLTPETPVEIRTLDGQLTKSRPAPTGVTTYDDSAFVRTALRVDDGGGSVDLVTATGERVAQVNVTWDAKARHLIVDVIDVDELFADRGAFVFPGKKVKRRKYVKAGSLVSADFRPHSAPPSVAPGAVTPTQRPA